MNTYELEELLYDMDPEWHARFPDAYTAAQFYGIDVEGTRAKAEFYRDKMWTQETEDYPPEDDDVGRRV